MEHDKKCTQCHKHAKLMCGKCKKALYCSHTCAKIGWRSTHYMDCGSYMLIEGKRKREDRLCDNDTEVFDSLMTWGFTENEINSTIVDGIWQGLQYKLEFLKTNGVLLYYQEHRVNWVWSPDRNWTYTYTLIDQTPILVIAVGSVYVVAAIVVVLPVWRDAIKM